MTSRSKDVEGLVSFANRVLAASDALATVAPRFPEGDPGEHALGGEAPGKLGDLCRHLHSRLAEALAARGQEATAQSGRMRQTAIDLGRIAADYADIDITLSSKVRKAHDDTASGQSTVDSGTLPPGNGHDIVIEAG